MNFLITILIRGCGSKDKTNLRNKHHFDGFSFHLISRVAEMEGKDACHPLWVALVGNGTFGVVSFLSSAVRIKACRCSFVFLTVYQWMRRWYGVADVQE